MSTKYKFSNPEGIYFVSFATVGWVDVFTRSLYKDIFCESVRYCQEFKGMRLHAWCIMSNHVHLIFSRIGEYSHSDIIRDLKKYTSKKIIESIQNNFQESRKEWLLDYFQKAGMKNSNNQNFQFWQQDNHPIELFSPLLLFQKIDYIHANPVVSGLVDESEHYIYCSARDYTEASNSKFSVRKLNTSTSIYKSKLDVVLIERPGTLEGYVFNY